MISQYNPIELRHWIGFWISTFSVAVVSFRGHAGAAIVLLVTAFLVAAFIKPKLSFQDLNPYERIFIALLICWYGVQLFGIIYQPPGYELENLRAQLKALDHPSRWVLLLPVFFLFRSYLIDWRYAALGLSLGAVVSTGIAHYQVYFLGLARAYGGATHAIPYAELMVAIDLVLWMYMVYAWDKGYKTLSVALLVSSLIAFYGSLLTVTRGAWLVYIAMVVIWILYLYKNSIGGPIKLFSKPIMFRILLAGLVYFGVSQTRQYDLIESRMSSTFNNLTEYGVAAVDKARATIYEDSWKVVKDYPFGIGTNNFQAIKVDSVFTGPHGYRFTHAHNQWINILVQNGIQGLIAFSTLMLFVFYVFWRSLKSHNELVRLYAAIGMLLLFSYSIFGLTQAVFKHKDTLMFFVFYLYFFFGQVQVLLRKDEKLFT